MAFGDLNTNFDSNNIDWMKSLGEFGAFNGALNSPYQSGGFNNNAAMSSFGGDNSFDSLGGYGADTSSFGGNVPDVGAAGEGFDWGSVGSTLQGIAGLAQAWQGMQSLKLGKKELGQNKDIFNLNYGAQSKLTNQDMLARREATLGARGGDYSSLESFMDKNRISETGIA